MNIVERVQLPERAVVIQGISDAWRRLSTDGIHGGRGITQIQEIGGSLDYLFWILSPTRDTLTLRVLADNGEQWSLRSYVFNHNLETGIIRGSTESRTRADQESRGLATGLGLISKAVVLDAKERYSERFQGRTIVTESINVAIGRGLDENGRKRERNGWGMQGDNHVYDPVTRIRIKTY